MSPLRGSARLYAEQQQHGGIEGSRPVLLQPHGGVRFVALLGEKAADRSMQLGWQMTGQNLAVLEAHRRPVLP